MADEKDPETYGTGAGWSDATTERAPEPEGATGESPTPDATPDSSSAETQPEAAQTAPAEPKKEWNLPPEQRWEELRQQRLQAEERAAKAEQLAQLALQKLQTPQVQAPPEVDPYAGMDPQTAEFYRNMDTRMVRHAQAIAAQQVQPLMQVIDAGRKEIARLNAKDFRKENPDITPGSPEENLVASYMMGQMDGVQHTIESARKNVLFDKLEAENRALKTKQSAVPQKRAAAQTERSSGIPSTAGLPAKQGDWREKASEVLDKGGSVKDVLGLVFGGGR